VHKSTVRVPVPAVTGYEGSVGTA